MDSDNRNEIFSFHLVDLPLLKLPKFLFSPLHTRTIAGLKHSESFLTMKLGESVVSPSRYGFKKAALFAWWNDESSLDRFLESHRVFGSGWHVRMKLYRRWGRVTEIQHAKIDPGLAPKGTPVVAVTLARLKLSETLRFTKWGKPVERQVRDHKGHKLAFAAFRPINTFCTFSIWNNEAEMISMVQGDGESHKLAMEERVRKDFHHEFTTMRFAPFMISESTEPNSL